VQQPGQLKAGRPGLIAGSQPTGIAKAANEPAHRWLVMADLVDRGQLLTRGKDTDRDRVTVHVKTKMDGGEMRHTSHGRLLPYVGSARSVWVTHADADRSRPLHAD
jgi:hypothetical protein